MADGRNRRTPTKVQYLMTVEVTFVCTRMPCACFCQVSLAGPDQKNKNGSKKLN